MIITFTNVIGAIRNAISSVITTNLKMWLGFETSETLGREEVIDGDFILTGTQAESTTGAYWTTGIGWTISGGVANINATSLYKRLSQSLNTTIGSTYVIKVNCNSYTSGYIYLRKPIQSGVADTDNRIDSLGEFEFTLTITSDNDEIAFANGTLDTILSINNISIKELTQITPDKSGNNNVGELFTGKAIELDGSNDEINFGTAQIPIKTISFWIKPLSVSNEGLFYLGLSGFPQFRQISITSGNISATSYLTNFTPYVNNIQTSAVTQDVWQRVVLTFDEWTTTSLQIGKVYSSVYGHFAISDVQFYNETWTTDDIAYDYANPNKLAIDNPSTSLSVTNLKGYWALSEGDGLVAYDSGTNLEEEEVTNGDFSNGTTGWSPFFNASLTIDNERLAITPTTSSSSRATQGFTTQIGKAYLINANFDNPNLSNVLIGLSPNSNGSGATFDTSNQSSGSINVLYTATTTTTYVSLSRLVNDTKTIYYDNVSVREVTASDHGGLINGADYVDAQPRIPQLGMMNWSKGSNLFSYSQDFSQWNKEATVTLTPNYGTSPSGANDSTRMQMNANDSLYLDNAGSSKTFSIYVKGTQGETIRLSNGVAQIFTLTGNWDRIQLYDTSASSTLYSINTYSGATARDMEIWGGQLEESSSASAYRLTDGAATLNSTVIPNPTIPTQDIFGNAVRDRLNSFNLDGSGYAEVADDADLDMSSGFSTSFWVKLDEGTTTTDYNFLVCKGRGIGATNSTYGFGTTYYNNNIIATINTSVSKYQVTSSSQNPTGQWLFVCVTYEPNTTLGLKLYLDDNLPNSITVSGTVDESHNLNVGRDSSFITTRQSKNIISDVLFYDSVLTSDEIENNYNAGLSAHTND